MRAFVQAHPDIVHAEVNVTEEASRELAQAHAVRSIPAYRLVDPSSKTVLYRQNGGSPDHDALDQEIERWQAAKAK